MTLKELAVEYRKAAVPIRIQLKELRAALAKAETAEARWKIKRRIAELAPILTDLNKVAHLLEHYYERGYWRDKSISSNAFADRQSGNKKKKKAFVHSDSERADGSPEGYVSGILRQGPQHVRNCRRKRSKQEHHLQNVEKSRRQNIQNHTLSLESCEQDIDQIVNSFLHKKEKDNEK